MKITTTRQKQVLEKVEVEVLRSAKVPAWLATWFPVRCRSCKKDFHNDSRRNDTCTVVETKAGPFFYHDSCFKIESRG